MSRPTAALMDAALRVLAYLNKHKDVGLRYQCDSQNRLRGYSDADWAVQRSQSGFVFTLGRASISWGSKRQPVVALSTCEAELMAATEAAKEAVHLRRLHADSPLRITRRQRAFISTTWAPLTPRTITRTTAG